LSGRSGTLLGFLIQWGGAGAYRGALAGYVEREAAPGAPVVLTADLNASPRSDTLNRLHRIGFVDPLVGETDLDDIATCCAERVMSARVPRSDGAGAVFPSDHAGLLSSLSYGRQ
jgi:hypothetical protein